MRRDTFYRTTLGIHWHDRGCFLPSKCFSYANAETKTTLQSILQMCGTRVGAKNAAVCRLESCARSLKIITQKHNGRTASGHRVAHRQKFKIAPQLGGH